MSNDYNYDADAQFFPFFILTMSGLVTLPLTYSLLRSPTDDTTSSKAGRIDSSYQPNNVDVIDAQRAKQKRKELRLKRMITALIGWAIMAYMVYLMIVTIRTQVKIWDPYDILDVSRSATEKQINSRYRRLSTTMHPDKRRPNAESNMTMEMINDQWVEIVKAYKALTDEEIRNNYLQYGNPDGKQSTSFGIALPTFLVADGTGKYVLALYGLLLGIGLPWLVGQWWYGSQSMTRERVLTTSAANMFREFDERMDPNDVLATLSGGAEFRDILHGSKAENGLGRIENALSSLEKGGVIMLPKDKKKLNDLEDPVRRKTLALLWAYLTRLDLADRTLESEKYELAPTAMRLNDAFLAFCLAYGYTAPVTAAYQLAQCFTQAVPPTAASRAPLLQLPHFTPSIVQSIEKATTSHSKGHLSVQAFMALPAEQRQALARAAGLTGENLRVAEGVARQLPRFQIEKTFFKVQGEKYILPSSLVTYVVKGRFIPPGTANIPPIDEKDLLDPDPAEGDLKAQKIEQEQHYAPLAHAPFFARDRAPRYHIFLADNRQGKIAVPPFTFVSFDKKPFDAEGKPTFAVVTLKMQFAAPPSAGEYKFYMHMLCDSYLGFDDKREAVMNVEEASKAQEMEEDDDISEPEEDTIAGQMAALKGDVAGDASQRKAKKQAKKVDEESDYESGTDEDEDYESETDTDTDSEAEDEQAKSKGWW